MDIKCRFCKSKVISTNSSVSNSNNFRHFTFFSKNKQVLTRRQILEEFYSEISYFSNIYIIHTKLHPKQNKFLTNGLLENFAVLFFLYRIIDIFVLANVELVQKSHMVKSNRFTSQFGMQQHSLKTLKKTHFKCQKK